MVVGTPAQGRRSQQNSYAVNLENDTKAKVNTPNEIEGVVKLVSNPEEAFKTSDSNGIANNKADAD